MKRKFMKYAMFSILFIGNFSAETVHAEQYTGQAIWPSEYIGVYIKKLSQMDIPNTNKVDSKKKSW